MPRKECDFEYHRDNKESIFDGHGIYLTSICDRCPKDKLDRYRADIFDQYDADEPIDEK